MSKIPQKKQVKDILAEQTSLGIELGSTRIKAILIDSDNSVLASGGYNWENQLTDGYWSYSEDEIIKGLQAAYRELKEDFERKYNTVLSEIGTIGISAMMHGYIALNDKDELLVPFRTWRNNYTLEAAKKLSEHLDFHIPNRWSIAHLYQAVLNKEKHLEEVKKVTTLAGYIHYLLTGEFVLGIGDASGMFPIDKEILSYRVEYIKKVENMLSKEGKKFEILKLFPRVETAGKTAGKLTEKGRFILDTTGDLKADISFCAPEGDAGTGMIATNSIRPRTGNVSAGTSIFSMIVLENELGKPYEEVDIVSTPIGDNVAMVHANNCSSEINVWADLFGEFAAKAGLKLEKSEIYSLLFKSMTSENIEKHSVLAYPYHSGEDLVNLNKGFPSLIRKGEDALSLASLMKAQLYSAFVALSLGMDILVTKEDVKIDSILGHGGVFKTAGVAQRLLAAALCTPVEVMETAGEGGAFGMAVLANFARDNKNYNLHTYLEREVFAGMDCIRLEPSDSDIMEFKSYLERFKAYLPVMKQIEEI